MKRALLIHGFEGSNSGNWLPWLAEQLTEKGYDVINETWPDSFHPNTEVVMDFFHKKTKNFSETDIIVGHSLGAFWALKIAENLKLNGLYLVAPAIGNLDYQNFRLKWKDADIDSLQRTIDRGFNRSLINANHKVAIFSDDDPWIPLTTQELLDDSWNIVELHDQKHILALTIPELLDLID